jgi:signal peptidase I
VLIRVVRRVPSLLGTGVLLTLAIGAVAVALGVLRITPVLSGSMRPGLSPGDSVLTRRVDAQSLQVGDIVVLTVPPRYGGGSVVHRITSVSRDGGATTVTTKGDANSVGDPWRVTLPGRAYRVVTVIPYLGWIVDAKAHGALAVLWTLLAIVLAVAGVRWFIRYKRPHHSSSQEGLPCEKSTRPSSASSSAPPR